MIRVQISDEDDAALEALAPKYLAGEKNATARIAWVTEQYLRLREDAAAEPVLRSGLCVSCGTDRDLWFGLPGDSRPRCTTCGTLGPCERFTPHSDPGRTYCRTCGHEETDHAATKDEGSDRQ